MAERAVFDGLIPSLGLGERELVSIVGAGGKTTLMYRLTEELHRAGAAVAAATTTKIFAPGEGDPVTLLCGHGKKELLEGLKAPSQKPLVLGKRLLEGNKVAGIGPDRCDEIHADGVLDYLIVEADGARRRPVKAPGEDEPVVPSSTTVFVAVLGVTCLHGKLDESTAFRPELVARAGKLGLGETITTDSLVNLLTVQGGLRKGCPQRARAVVVLNQVHTEAQMFSAREIADRLLTRAAGWERVVIAHLALDRPVEEVWMS